MPSTVTALIPAAGAGSRLGDTRNKVLLPLAGLPMLVHTVRVFQRHPRIAHVAVIVRDGEQAALERCFAEGPARDKLLPWITGGAERQDSVYNGLAALAQRPPDWVLVHDGARPCCPPELVDRVLGALERAPGAVPVVPVTDTVRRMANGHSEVVDRSALVRTQTPQGFHWTALWQAHRRARETGLRGTDDAQLLEAGGAQVVFVAGDAGNVKMTTPEDLEYGAWRLAGHGGRG